MQHHHLGARLRAPQTVLCLAALILGLLSFSAPAEAEVGRLRYVSRTLRVPVGTTRALRAPCPRRTSVLGGGVDIEGGHGATTVNTTTPFDGDDRGRQPDDGWLGAVSNGAPAPPSSRLMTVFAVCASGRYQYPTLSLNVLTPEDHTREVACPAGSVVTGGGVSISVRNAFTYVSQTYPIDSATDGDSIRSDGWGAAIRLSGPKDGTMRVTAICTVPDGNQWQYVEAPLALPSPGYAVARTAECGAGWTVTGGGMFHGGGYPVTLHTTEPYDAATDADLTRDNGWTAKLSNPSGSSVMTTVAICTIDV
jgi:hypothetical protein